LSFGPSEMVGNTHRICWNLTSGIKQGRVNTPVQLTAN
jgi:hypothetical protein